MTAISVFGLVVSTWIVVPVVYFFWVTILLLFKKVLIKILTKLVSRTKTRIDDILVEALDFPLTLLIFTSGGLIIERLLPRGEAELTNAFLVAFKVVTIVAVVLFIDKFINNSMKEYSGKLAILKATGSIARGIVRMVVIGLGFMMLLDSLGVSITPLIASLGVGSLAIALALQPTLENLFAGVQLVVDKPIQIGQFVQLESGEEGYIHKIGWRSTWVRMLQNNTVVMPNKTLVNAKIINYYYPERELAVLVQCGVHYDSDLEQVERVTVEVAKETLQNVPGGVSDFQPFIRYHTFDAYSINFSVILRAKEFVDNYLLKHEFIKRLHRRYRQEGIVIPYPIRAINYGQEKAFEEQNKKE